MNKVDFITTPGYLEGPGARERVGLPANSGPYRVITQLAVYDFDEASKRMRLKALHPGVSVDDVRANSSFDILIPDHVERTEPPSAEEQRLLREIDPAGMIIGK